MANINSNIHDYEPLWESWKVEELVGQGASGKVYKISKELFDKKHISAVKIITLDKQKCIREFSLPEDTKSQEFISYFDEMIKNIIKEIEFLYLLNGTPNIIRYDDYLIKKQDRYVDVLIKMEYARPLKDYVNSLDGNLSEHEVVRIGIDICKALRVCHSNKILHRDIKEDNIFVSENNAFKLGDFGVAKDLTEHLNSHTRIGTLDYIAPEAFNGNSYDSKADIYSLGVVLYKLANNGRIPFLINFPGKFTIDDVNIARKRRLSGELPELPLGVSEQLSKVILKACHPLPGKRYQSVTELQQGLEMFASSASESRTLKSFSDFPTMHNYNTVSSKNLNYFDATRAETPSSSHKDFYEQKVLINSEENHLPPKNGTLTPKFIAILSCFAGLCLLGLLILFLYLNNFFTPKIPPIASNSNEPQVSAGSNNSENLEQSPDEISPSPSPSPVVSPNYEKLISALFVNYESGLETAVSTGEFAKVEPYMLKESKIYNMQKNYIADRFAKGTKIKMTDFKKGATRLLGKDAYNRDCYEVDVIEYHIITYKNGTSENINLSWTYSVCNDGVSFVFTDLRRDQK